MFKFIKTLYFKLRVIYLNKKYFKKVRLRGMSQVCPKCQEVFDEYPAISRRDNKTEICPRCGVEEAMEDFNNYMNSNK
jgi:predicted RNA-binding Zn-ribbon protein involved in translation (DUF1610 family)